MYRYEKMKSELFKEENQKEFLTVRDKVHELLDKAGAIKLENVFLTLRVSNTDMWLTYMDRLVELNEIKELKRDCIAQHRIFISTK